MSANGGCGGNSPEGVGTYGPKRKRARGSQHTKSFKKRRALEQTIAKDRPRHATNLAQEVTPLEVRSLAHSAPAYMGNLARLEPSSIPQELGSGLKLLKYMPGYVQFG